MNCKNCKAEVNQNYCPNCGHPIVLRRIDGHYIFQEFRNVMNFEHGFLFTIRELIINPGKNIKEFLTENRNRLVKLVVFLLITSLIYTVLKNLIHFEDGYVTYSGEIESATRTILTWIQENYGYSNSIMAVFIAFWLKLFFRKYNYNIFEIIILLCDGNRDVNLFRSWNCSRFYTYQIITIRGNSCIYLYNLCARSIF